MPIGKLDLAPAGDAIQSAQVAPIGQFEKDVDALFQRSAPAERPADVPCAERLSVEGHTQRVSILDRLRKEKANRESQ
jgi:hypothetical protein